MKKKILTIILIVLIFLTVKFLLDIFINNSLIEKYNNGEYIKLQAIILSLSDIFEKYVADYNYGNILYQIGEYDNAIEKYSKALLSHPSKNKEASIRINYALAICKTVYVDETNQDSIKEAIKTYESAIEVLTETEINLYSAKAEELRKDIQAEIDRLKRLLEEEPSEEEEQKDENESQKETDSVESKIQDIKESAIMEQRELENQYKNHDINFQAPEKNW